MNYILVSVLDRDIYVRAFDRYEDARSAMLQELYNEYDFYYDSGKNKDTPDQWENIERQSVYSTPDFGFDRLHAYSNMIFKCNWRICPVEEMEDHV